MAWGLEAPAHRSEGHCIFCDAIVILFGKDDAASITDLAARNSWAGLGLGQARQAVHSSLADTVRQYTEP